MPRLYLGYQVPLGIHPMLNFDHVTAQEPEDLALMPISLELWANGDRSLLPSRNVPARYFQASGMAGTASEAATAASAVPIPVANSAPVPASR
jgi:hypothetical protein